MQQENPVRNVLKKGDSPRKAGKDSYSDYLQYVQETGIYEPNIADLLEKQLLQSGVGLQEGWDVWEGNLDEVVFVSQKQYAITKSVDQYPVLATFGLGPCVALVGYDQESQVGFMTHYSVVQETKSFSELLLLLEVLGSKTEDYRVALVGGTTKASEALIGGLRQITSLFDMGVVHEEILGVDLSGRSVVLDTRTGEIFKVGSIEPPSEKDMMRFLWEGPAELLYFPDNTNGR